MSRAADGPRLGGLRRPAAARRSRPDVGFSLIEIVVALGIFSIVLVALLPQLVVGIRATTTARTVTQAKGVSQGQLERMRHLPFHIAPAAGDFVDVLDYYFPDLGAPTTTPVCMSGGEYALPAVGWTGYVAAVSGGRCDYEPASGAFFRTVKEVPASAGITAFTIVVDTQFLSGSTPPEPVSPQDGYDTGTVGKDSPASSQIGVTATVIYDRRGTLKPVTTYTQISERLSTTARVRSEIDVRVLDLSAVMADGTPLTMAAGLLNLTGAVSYASTVDASLATTSAALAAGESAAGASTTLTAPPSASGTVANSLSGGLTTGGCNLACWGSTTIPGFDLAADEGAPLAGSQISPAQVKVTDRTSGGISFGASASNDYLPRLKLAPPLVRIAPDPAPALPTGIGALCVAADTGGTAYLSASGYLRTAPADAATPDVESCGVARASTLWLFPTNFAPDGIVQVELEKASARCLVSGASHDETTALHYAATVRYFNGSGYTPVNVAEGDLADALAAVPMNTAVADGLTIGDYISSWSALSADQVVRDEAAGIAQVKMPGVVRLTSQPLRPATDAVGGPDMNSAVSMTLGAITCRAEDHR